MGSTSRCRMRTSPLPTSASNTSRVFRSSPSRSRLSRVASSQRGALSLPSPDRSDRLPQPSARGRHADPGAIVRLAPERELATHVVGRDVLRDPRQDRECDPLPVGGPDRPGLGLGRLGEPRFAVCRLAQPEVAGAHQDQARPVGRRRDLAFGLGRGPDGRRTGPGDGDAREVAAPLEGQVVAVRAPEQAVDRARIEVGQRQRSALRRVHHPHVLHAAAVPEEGNARAVGRPDRVRGMFDVDERIDRERAAARRVRPHHPRKARQQQHEERVFHRFPPGGVDITRAAPSTN